MSDEEFEFHVDQLAALVRETMEKIDAARRAGMQPDEATLDLCRRLEIAIVRYRATAPQELSA
jgi:hypothetical protein